MIHQQNCTDVKGKGGQLYHYLLFPPNLHVQAGPVTLELTFPEDGNGGKIPDVHIHGLQNPAV